jgi:two-component system sensor histidine kinase KdpD
MTTGGRSRDAMALALVASAVALSTAALRSTIGIGKATIPALTYLLIVLVTATASRLWVAIAASLVAVLALNFFFMPPVGTFTLDDPQNWVALFAFLTVSVVASQLSAQARDRAREATARRDEVSRLFDLSRDILLTTDSREAIGQLARFIARRFQLEYTAICLPRAGTWEVFDAGSYALKLDDSQLSQALARADKTVEYDARARTYSGQLDVSVGETVVRIVPLRVGTKAVGLLLAPAGAVEPGTLDALAGVAAIAIERAQFLDERKAAELARQGEELKSALLASIGHDLRTPLTAIKVAASNLQASWLSESERREQSELILAEGERLTRLFQNILAMARIDAGAVSAEPRWVHPSEILEAARDQVAHAMRHRRLDVTVDGDRLFQLDPRLTASALAHVLENAAQYTPADTPLDVKMTASPEGLVTTVRDHGPGITAADLPHLFERFYRGDDAKRHVPGTGMGLAIARGLLSAQHGRIWAENAVDGGAQVTFVVPAASKSTDAIESLE